MKCPFPGMDPYREASGLWPDFHERFLIYLSDELNDRLPEDYETRIDERVRIMERNRELAKDFLQDVSLGRELRLASDIAAPGATFTP